MGENLVGLGVGGIFCLLVLKEVLPYFKEHNGSPGLPPVMPAHVMMTIKEQILPILARQTEILAALQQGQQWHHDHEIQEIALLDNLQKGVDHIRASNHVFANTEQAVVMKLEQILRKADG